MKFLNSQGKVKVLRASIEDKKNLTKKKAGTSLVVQWCAPSAGGLGSIPGQGAIS